MGIINERFGSHGAAKPRRRGDVIEGKPKGSKRAPVLFCVDASYSMMSPIASETSERTRMDLLNDMIRAKSVSMRILSAKTMKATSTLSRHSAFRISAMKPRIMSFSRSMRVRSDVSEAIGLIME